MTKNISLPVCIKAASALAVALWAAPSAAAGEAPADCYAPLALYEGGLPGLFGEGGSVAEERIAELTTSFHDMLAASEKSFGCFEQALAHETDAASLAALHEGVMRAGDVFSRAQAEFETSLDAMSAEVLTGVEPAAGEGTTGDADAAAQALAGMETLFDSYMALERSAGIAERLGRLAVRKG